ncbi:hypothetical protein AC579_1114 [Pseudocercospora musae]|uniref:Uncharacterized protein n=1 Tax=Pseudocercospora musae TaxID=113226 RepID=A0A139I071_9PEZI|nr:hypothetical protein AC579_1114 [Pseudocercospora musae]
MVWTAAAKQFKEPWSSSLDKPGSSGCRFASEDVRGRDTVDGVGVSNVQHAARRVVVINRVGGGEDAWSKRHYISASSQQRRPVSPEK